MTYEASGLVLDTEISMPELSRVHRLDADCTFHIVSTQNRTEQPLSWIFERKSTNGQTRLAIAKNGSGYLVRFPSAADFFVSDAGRTISCVPRPAIATKTIRSLLLDQVLPIALPTPGRLVLHGSSAEVEEGALVFLGQSGVGKSTLAAALCERGGALLADDCVVVERRKDRALTVASSSAESDRSLRARPITGVYVLDPLEAASNCDISRVTMAPLLRRAACMELMKSSFQLDITDPSATCRSFKEVGELASVCPVARLQYVQDVAYLPTVVDALLRP